MLEELYYGRFVLWEQIRTTSEAYLQALKNYDSILEQLSSRLDKEEYELVLR